MGAFGTFLFLLSRRRLTRKTITASLSGTLRTTAMLFVLFIGAGIFGNFLALSGLPIDLAEWASTADLPRYVILAITLLLLIPVGAVMDILSMILVILPIVYPIIQELGFNLIWYCILVQLMTELGLITPPVGLNVFILTGITGLPAEKIFRAVIPFCIADLILVIILVAFPQITLWLPSMMMG